MQYQCSHCERVFSHRSALRNHIKTHINKIDRILEKIAEESSHDVEMIDVDKQNDPVDYESQALLNVEEDEEMIDIEEEEDIEDIEDEEEEEEEEEDEEEEKLIDDDQVRFILNYISSISSSTKSLF